MTTPLKVITQSQTLRQRGLLILLRKPKPTGRKMNAPQTLIEQATHKLARVPQKPYVYGTSRHPNAK